MRDREFAFWRSGESRFVTSSKRKIASADFTTWRITSISGDVRDVKLELDFENARENEIELNMAGVRIQRRRYFLSTGIL